MNLSKVTWNISYFFKYKVLSMNVEDFQDFISLYK